MSAAPDRTVDAGARRRHLKGPPAVFLALSLLLPFALTAQSAGGVDPSLLEAVMPQADRFTEVRGDPPVIEGYAVDPETDREILVGYAFLTSDIPPESHGYDAPIQMLVGMDLEGSLTGARVIDYRESLRRSRGDFLARAGIQGQFTGKSITDPFRVRQDIESITGATITVAAMALGVRNAARRVAVAYLRGPEPAGSAGPAPRIAALSPEELDRLTWPEMVQLELVLEIVSDEGGGREPFMVSLVYLRDEVIAERVIGSTRFPDAYRRAGERVGEDHLMLLGLNGPNVTFFNPQAISFVQGADSYGVAFEDFIATGLLPDGKAQGEFRRTGLLLVDGALDVTRPFTVAVDLGESAGTLAAEYTVHEPAPASGTVASGNGNGDEATDSEDAGVADGGEADEDRAAGAEEPAGGTPSEEGMVAVEGASGAGGSEPAGSGAGTLDAVEGPPLFDFSDEELAGFLFADEEEEGSALARTLAQTSWARVFWLLVLLAVVTWAFVSKSAPVRWVALGGTLIFLGFLDRGFLSVSHLIVGISGGPEVYLRDVSLLIMVSFTVATTLLFGRIFCGFLCPFGAIQDFLERIVPRAWRKELPRVMHERALMLKYFILAIVLAPAVIGIPVSVFQYFEPFGTVFYWSPSLLLWTIAIGILAASAIVPRFYCRYACPLGAALAVGSLLSPFRIRRVEQCTVCKVCERKCPTGAINGPDIDFKECVRCNVCEIQLIERTGVCKHDMDEIRPRLVQLTTVRSESAP